MCTTKITSLATPTTTCTVTYTYTYSHAVAAALVRNALAEATLKVAGKAEVIGTGRIRKGKLVLSFTNPRRGHYRLTLLELSQGEPIVIGHATLTMSSRRHEWSAVTSRRSSSAKRRSVIALEREVRTADGSGQL